MANPQFGLAELAAAQAQPEVIVNALTRALAAALAGEKTINLAADADYNMVAADWPYATIVITDSGAVLTAARAIVYPDVDTQVGGPSRMRFVFRNETAQNLTLKRSGETGVVVAAGAEALVRHNGTDIVAL